MIFADFMHILTALLNLYSNCLGKILENHHILTDLNIKSVFYVLGVDSTTTTTTITTTTTTTTTSTTTSTTSSTAQGGGGSFKIGNL